MTRGLLRRSGVGLCLLLLPGSCLTPSAPIFPDGARGAAAATPAPGAAKPVAAKPVATKPMVLPAAPVRPATPIRSNEFALPRAPQQGLTMVGQAPLGASSVMLDGQTLPLLDDGSFLIGFDRDAAATATLTARMAGGAAVTKSLAVARGAWRIEQINAPYRGSASNDADFVRRRPAELAQINAARRVSAISAGWRQKFIWPVRGRLSGFFGSQRVYQGKPGSYHSGLDVAAVAGTPFVAPADGVVVLAASSPFTLEGNLLIVDHGMGLTSAFLHCARLDVAVGQIVRQGERLGAVGATGRATGPHLHWGLRWHQAKLDPLLLFQ